ncbi:MAG: TRAP transporter small permease [Betaproteobacteria bacterium]|nr:TRAP transporter small permease [Betaproteobacteria bacterium]
MRAYRRLLEGLAAAAALILGAAAFAVSLDVVLRNTGWGGFPWVLEASEYALPLATFLVAPWLLLRNEHVRLDILLHMASAALARALDVAANLAGLAVSLLLVVYGLRAIINSARQGSMIVKSMEFPEWWLYAPVPLCFALLAIEFLRRLVVREAHALGSGPQA